MARHGKHQLRTEALAGNGNVPAMTAPAPAGAKPAAGHISLRIGVALIALALAIPLAVGLSQYVNSRSQEDAFTQRVSDTAEDADVEEAWEAAVAYNKAWASGSLATAETLAYEEQLSYGGNDVVAQVIVPAVGINLPVRLGSSDEALAKGAGHVESTALPVGGTGTMCALSGHSGLASAQMFDALRDIEVGDGVEIWVCGRELWYAVESVEVVDDDALEDALSAARDVQQDTLVLFTCTSAASDFFPRGGYGVNDHRLVVVCRASEETEVDVDYRGVPTWAVPALAAACLAALAAAAIARRRKRGTGTGERAAGSSPRQSAGPARETRQHTAEGDDGNAE